MDIIFKEGIRRYYMILKRGNYRGRLPCGNEVLDGCDFNAMPFFVNSTHIFPYFGSGLSFNFARLPGVLLYICLSSSPNVGYFDRQLGR